MIYDEKGTDAQNRAWVELADRQLSALRTQYEELSESITDLQKLRDDVADGLG